MLSPADFAAVATALLFLLCLIIGSHLTTHREGKAEARRKAQRTSAMAIRSAYLVTGAKNYPKV